MQDLNSVEVLDDLIGFASVSCNSNLDIADYIASVARRSGGRVERFRSYDGRKEALLLAFGPLEPGGIVLSGHMDVVPANSQKWTSNPFRLRREDGRLYGRGAVDMKSFLALSLSCAASLKVEQLSKPLYLAFSYDEETTCDGVKPIVAYLRDPAPRPSCVIVGEPTEMRLVAAHKGAVDWKVRVTGKAAHSSLPQLGSNAIHMAAYLVQLIDQMGQEFSCSPAADAALFDVPFTTVSTGLIQGGSAPNIIPASCELHIEARPLKAADDAQIKARLIEFAEQHLLPSQRVAVPAAAVTVSEVGCIPPLVRRESSDAELLVASLIGSSKVEAVSYATEAGFFQAAGFPTVVFGPGSITQAHQPDEYISYDQLQKGEAFLQNLVRRLL